MVNITGQLRFFVRAAMGLTASLTIGKAMLARRKVAISFSELSL